MKFKRNAYQTRNLKRSNPIAVIGIVVAVTTLGLVRSVMGNEALILIAYPVGLALAAIAWYGKFQWKQTLWTVGMVLAAVSMAAMVLTAQFWLAVGAFSLFIAIIVGPTVREQTHEEVRRRREQNRH